ncbi:TcpQ domain-containing protein [Pseudoxanthomonas gei]|uniref:TcpQ domain-containing protein n=1 Tax=Pseudoxanthomonas gei TaxID=1383030 RepID=UPI0031B5A7B9
MKYSPAALFFCLLIPLLSACATRPAPDIKGRWKPVNRYAATAEEIPLYQSYVFHASPMDGTLKTMLTRWARDSKMTLSYLHPSDFTLYGPVAQIQTNDLQRAVSELSMAYAGQHVSVTAAGNQIVVRVAQLEEHAPATTP